MHLLKRRRIRNLVSRYINTYLTKIRKANRFVFTVMTLIRAALELKPPSNNSRTERKLI